MDHPEKNYDVAGANQPRTLLATCRKNRIMRLKTRKDTTKPMPTMTKISAGTNTETITDTIATTSSTTLATTFDTGSGLAFNIARVAAFVP